MPSVMQDKVERHRSFWQGRGPSLLLIPPAEQVLYDLSGYPRRFRNPQLMWESELRRAEPVVDWPTDGIPTVRPNLGVVFIPAMAGQTYRLPGDAMPWPGTPLDRDTLRAVSDVDVRLTETMRLAAEFYAIYQANRSKEIAAYQADTQGVFDIAHLLNGDQTFYEVVDQGEFAWMDQLLEICLDLYVRATSHLKTLLNEPATSMIHGHGTSQGLFFPMAGTRMAEDTAILLSPATIDRFVIPAVRRSAQPFGKSFVHFCGNHRPLLEKLCQLDEVCAIDLGNPELYDTRWVLERCAETGTVLYSRLAAEPNEDWRDYVQRLGRLVKQTHARVVLRPILFPSDRDQCQEMLDLWHAATDV